MKTRRAIFFAMPALLVLLIAHSGFAVIGETYDQMAARHGTPGRARFDEFEGNEKIARYEKTGAKVYIFHIDKFKVYAEFNSKNVCFKMVSLHNEVDLPKKSMLIGGLANTTPKVLMRIPRRELVLQYGEGESAVIFKTWGRLGNLNVEAVSKALEPK